MPSFGEHGLGGILLVFFAFGWTWPLPHLLDNVDDVRDTFSHRIYHPKDFSVASTLI